MGRITSSCALMKSCRLLAMSGLAMDLSTLTKRLMAWALPAGAWRRRGLRRHAAGASLRRRKHPAAFHVVSLALTCCDCSCKM